MKNEITREESKAFDCLAVTRVKVSVRDTEGAGLKGMADVVLNDQLMIRGIRIMEGMQGRLYLKFPMDQFRPVDDDCPIVGPLTHTLNDHITTCVLERYYVETSC